MSIHVWLPTCHMYAAAAGDAENRYPFWVKAPICEVQTGQTPILTPMQWRVTHRVPNLVLPGDPPLSRSCGRPAWELFFFRATQHIVRCGTGGQYSVTPDDASLLSSFLLPHVCVYRIRKQTLESSVSLDGPDSPTFDKLRLTYRPRAELRG